ncbi:MAG TPA: hypothetical protein PKA58_37215 [Polyangium sp.]|nr:hypothetical protein [Polyangium sp.]
MALRIPLPEDGAGVLRALSGGFVLGLDKVFMTNSPNDPFENAVATVDLEIGEYLLILRAGRGLHWQYACRSRSVRSNGTNRK